MIEPMKNLLDAATQAQMVTRLGALRADSKPRWGRMDAGSMLCHLNASLRMALSELPVRSKRMKAFHGFPLKHLMLYVLPFPKGAPTAPELLAGKPTGFAADRDALGALTMRFAVCAGGAEHPLFGVLSAREWGALQWKHMEHHLRQFGV
jgi:hypothetical protein